MVSPFGLGYHTVTIVWCLDSINPLWRRGWELYGRLYRARGICTDMASRVVSGIIQSLFSGSRKVCDIFVDSGMAMDAEHTKRALRGHSVGIQRALGEQSEP